MLCSRLLFGSFARSSYRILRGVGLIFVVIYVYIYGCVYGFSFRLSAEDNDRVKDGLSA